MSSGSTGDDIKGRLKEAAGSLLDDDELKHDGQADRAAGKVKETVEDAVDEAKDTVERLVDKAKDLVSGGK